jgi:hypothetical protein
MSTAANHDRALKDELKRAIAAIAEERSRRTAVGDAWLTNIDRLCQKVLTSEPDDFLNWDMISRTMVVGNADFVHGELDFLKGLPDWEGRWENAIEESPIGHPTYYDDFPSSSGNLIHQAYHLAQCEKTTGVDISRARFIFEFGGGYGSLCRLVHRLGFNGRYVIFDLPPFSALQIFFLKMNGISAIPSSAYTGEASSGVICVSELEHLESILADHASTRDAAFIATWSLSEAPVMLRQAILPLIRQFNTFLVAYQGYFGNVDNRNFFNEWVDTAKHIEWHGWKIEHLPNQLYRDNYYLMGRKR